MTLLEVMISLALSAALVLLGLNVQAHLSQHLRQIQAELMLQSHGELAMTFLTQSLHQAGLATPVAPATPIPTALKALGINTLLQGFDDARVLQSTAAGGSAWGWPHGNGGYQGSDTLVTRFPGNGQLSDCQGYTPAPGEWGQSVFWVREPMDADKEPTLSCVNTGHSSQPLLSGIEMLQVLFGVSPAEHLGPQLWWTAEQVDQAQSWPRVSLVRLGVVLRGPPGSQGATPPTIIYPLGEAFAQWPGGEPWRPPTDLRLRRAWTWTVRLRHPINW
jgi:type IV pilus assembly protein PilW